jgi:hypothetical protein
MTEEVWVQLYIGKDKSGREVKSGDVFDIDHVPNNISALKKAVHQAKGKSLGHCDTADLVVYKAGTESPPKEEDELDPGEAVPTATTSKNPLRVVAPANLNQQGKNVAVCITLPLIEMHCFLYYFLLQMLHHNFCFAFQTRKQG